MDWRVLCGMLVLTILWLGHKLLNLLPPYSDALRAKLNLPVPRNYSC